MKYNIKNIAAKINEVYIIESFVENSKRFFNINKKLTNPTTLPPHIHLQEKNCFTVLQKQSNNHFSSFISAT